MDYSELYHHGVKGMKWGVRKDLKKLRKFTGSKRFNSLTNKVNKLNKLNKKATAEATSKGYTTKQSDERKKKNAGRNWVTQNLSSINMQVSQMNMLQQQNQMAMQANMRNLSLAMTGGMNPFMFG